jgi:hypothetical protein
MVIQVSTTDPRSLKALGILATAAKWTRGHTKDGRSFFSIPSSSGHIYWVDSRECTCPDFTNRQEACKHILAVRLWIAQEEGKRAQQTTTRTKRADNRYASIFGADEPDPYCTGCGRHHLLGQHYTRMAS